MRREKVQHCLAHDSDSLRDPSSDSLQTPRELKKKHSCTKSDKCLGSATTTTIDPRSHEKKKSSSEGAGRCNARQQASSPWRHVMSTSRKSAWSCELITPERASNSKVSVGGALLFVGKGRWCAGRGITEKVFSAGSGRRNESTDGAL